MKKVKKPNNLNNFKFRRNIDDYKIIENNIKNNNKRSGNIHVYFRNLKKKLITHISEADAVFGAVAWLTDKEILEELAKVKNVSIVVQKEDFLRPDISSHSNWTGFLRQKYDSLNLELHRYEFLGNLLSEMSTHGDPSFEPIRCVGNYNYEKNPAFSRMHNKFIVFTKLELRDTTEFDFHLNYNIKPYAIWTGSFNFTENAQYSLENAIYIKDINIANAYFKEYGQIAAMSEPLDWTSKWVAPEWRLGT